MSIRGLWKPNIINLIGAVLGTPRDSSGRKNNTFLLFVLSFLVLSSVLIGSVFYRTARYRIELFCPPVTSITKSTIVPTLAIKKKVRKGKAAFVTNRTNAAKKVEMEFACGKTSVTVHATLQPPAPLPSSFYWVSLLMFLYLGVIYSIIRHPVTQEWFIEILYAWKGVPREKSTTGNPDNSDVTDPSLNRPAPPPPTATDEDFR